MGVATTGCYEPEGRRVMWPEYPLPQELFPDGVLWHLLLPAGNM